MHSEDSLNASSALQLLDTIVPDHVAGFAGDACMELFEFICPAPERQAKEKKGTRQKKKRLFAESVLNSAFNRIPLFIVSPRPLSLVFSSSVLNPFLLNVSLQGESGETNPRAVNFVPHIQPNQQRRQRLHNPRVL
jgi:hypothetical protein